VNKSHWKRRKRIKCAEIWRRSSLEVYRSIPDCMQAQEVTTEVKIQQIVQTMERYKKEIMELTEKLTLSTPPKV
jgi:DNA integrity scanning protein DisA with diadenylate cyclase activity